MTDWITNNEDTEEKEDSYDNDSNNNCYEPCAWFNRNGLMNF